MYFLFPILSDFLLQITLPTKYLKWFLPFKFNCLYFWFLWNVKDLKESVIAWNLFLPPYQHCSPFGRFSGTAGLFTRMTVSMLCGSSGCSCPGVGSREPSAMASVRNGWGCPVPDTEGSSWLQPTHLGAWLCQVMVVVLPGKRNKNRQNASQAVRNECGKRKSMRNKPAETKVKAWEEAL